MSKLESLSRFNLIIKKLRNRSADFEAIHDYLERESELQERNFRVSKRTFQRDLNDIRSLLNIDIRYDASRKVYFIDDAGQPEVNNRMLEAFDTFQALNVSDGLSRHIHFEKRNPQGTENLFGLLHAINNKFQIKFSYKKFWDEETSQRTVEPYALKEFKNRWYILAKDGKDDRIKTFALDRLTNLEITKTKFEFPVDYNADESFRFCFGIISPSDEEPQEIVLSFDAFQGKYIKTLPLHHTQQVLVDNDDELRIKLKLCVTHDLVMEILSYAEMVKVIAPDSLKNEIRERYGKALKHYD